MEPTANGKGEKATAAAGSADSGALHADEGLLFAGADGANEIFEHDEGYSDEEFEGVGDDAHDGGEGSWDAEVKHVESSGGMRREHPDDNLVEAPQPALSPREKLWHNLSGGDSDLGAERGETVSVSETAVPVGKDVASHAGGLQSGVEATALHGSAPIANEVRESDPLRADADFSAHSVVETTTSLQVEDDIHDAEDTTIEDVVGDVTHSEPESDPLSADGRLSGDKEYLHAEPTSDHQGEADDLVGEEAPAPLSSEETPVVIDLGSVDAIADQDTAASAQNTDTTPSMAVDSTVSQAGSFASNSSRKEAVAEVADIPSQHSFVHDDSDVYEETTPNGAVFETDDVPSTQASAFEFEQAAAVDAVEPSAAIDAAASSENGELSAANGETRPARSRSMLTTERSFVMEDDDTVKADDTVVVSERMSTDGEDDFDGLSLPSEGYRAGVAANNTSLMSPVLEQRTPERLAAEESSPTFPSDTISPGAKHPSEEHASDAASTRTQPSPNSGSHHATSENGFVKPPPASPTVFVPPKRASIMAPTASSAAKVHGDEDESTTKKSPPLLRRKSSGIKAEISETGFIKPPPAPPTVPVPPKRASIMAPTASYAAKHQSEDAPVKTPTRVRTGTPGKPEVSDTGFVKPPPAPPTVPVPPKRASIMAPTASYAAKHQSEAAPTKKSPTRTRAESVGKPVVSDTGFVKPPPPPPTVPIAPKRASIMAPTASSSAKHSADGNEERGASKTPPRRQPPAAKGEVSETGFIKPPPPPPTVPVMPKRASIFAPTASSAARNSTEKDTTGAWAEPPKPSPNQKPTEFTPTVPVRHKRASIMAPTASFMAKSAAEAPAEEEAPPVEPKQPLYRNKRYANVQSKVRGIINAPAKAKDTTQQTAPAVEDAESKAPVQKPTLYKNKRYANVQSKVKGIIQSTATPDNDAVERRRSLGATAKRNASAPRRSPPAGTSKAGTGRSSASSSPSSSEASDAFAQAVAQQTHRKKVNKAVPRYLSYQNSGVFAQRAQVQQDRRRRLEEENASKSESRQNQLRVMFAQNLHNNYNAEEAEHAQNALGNVRGTLAAKNWRLRQRETHISGSGGPGEPSGSGEERKAPVAIAGGVMVLPSIPVDEEEAAVVDEPSPVTVPDAPLELTSTSEVDIATQKPESPDPVFEDDGVAKRINFDDASDDEEEEAEAEVTPLTGVA